MVPTHTMSPEDMQNRIIDLTNMLQESQLQCTILRTKNDELRIGLKKIKKQNSHIIKMGKIVERERNEVKKHNAELFEENKILFSECQKFQTDLNEVMVFLDKHDELTQKYNNMEKQFYEAIQIIQKRETELQKQIDNNSELMAMCGQLMDRAEKHGSPKLNRSLGGSGRNLSVYREQEQIVEEIKRQTIDTKEDPAMNSQHSQSAQLIRQTSKQLTERLMRRQQSTLRKIRKKHSETSYGNSYQMETVE